MAEQINDRVDNPAGSGVERYVGLEHLDPDSLRIRRWGEITDVESTKLRFRPGDIIFGKRRVYQRKIAVADFDGICSAHAMVLRAKPGVVLPTFLPFFMQSDCFMERALAISVGSLSPTINWKTLAKEEFTLPPIEEQRRITKALMAARNAYEVASAAHDVGHTLRDRLIAHFIEYGVTACSRRPTEIGCFPAHWEVRPLCERYDIQLGKMVSQAARRGGEQVPYMRNANVQWNRLDLSDVATMSFTEAEREKFSLRTGDILVCEGRHVGKSAIWRDEIPGACYQKALHRLRPQDTTVDHPGFLLLCLRYYSITGRFIKVTGETTIPHLPAERFRQVVFPFPPYTEQIKICNIIAKLDESLQSLNDRVASIRRVLNLVLDPAAR